MVKYKQLRKAFSMETDSGNGNNQAAEQQPGEPDKQADQDLKPKRWEDMNKEERQAALERARTINESRDERRRRGFN
jgi:hypothetical protein